MTIWDADNLNALHTEREIAMIEQSAPRKMTLDEAWAQRMSHMRSFSGQQDDVIAHAMRNDAGWMAWEEVKRLRSERDALLTRNIEMQGHMNGKWELLDSVAVQEAKRRHIAIVEAERASWPHAGPLHDGARQACDAIAARIRAMMGA